MTALGLARNSDIFKAGVDMHGVHDWYHWALAIRNDAPFYEPDIPPAALALVTEMGSDLREGELVQLADRLYEVFVKARTDPGQELDSINALLRRSAAAPHLSRQANRIVADWRLEGGVRRDDPVSGLLQAACVLALYEWLSGAGSLERIGVCSAHRCVDIFIDGSQAGSRRYCSDICGNRAKVAAHRARLRARSGLTPSGRSPRDEHQATK
jgi:predicted RNA-binding Zn ribbon-like protein